MREQLNTFFNKLIGLIEAFPKSSFLSLFLVGIFLGYWGGAWQKEKDYLQVSQKDFQLRQKEDYKFINPLLECEAFEKGSFIQANKIEEKIQKVVDGVPNNPGLEHLSVYLRDLNNGPWLGYNENEKFTPASLLKVPIMMAYFKKAESDPNFLEKKIFYQAVPQDEQGAPNIQPRKSLKFGQEYTVFELIEEMIVYSDNKASNLLLKNIDEIFLEKVYTDLAISIPGENELAGDFMTVKDYASFFRILYNASYLNREMSEKALELLSRSDFRDGLVAGLPEGTVVAHKFGERRQGALVQLHDCGVIYGSKTPYLLCVMTRGGDFSELKKMIEEVSRMVGEELLKK